MIHFLVHEQADNVGVATVDIPAGTAAVGRYMDNQAELKVKVRDAIPLGHKLALRDLAVGAAALKYGHDIGRIVAAVKAGGHVHVQNLKTKRW